MVVVTPSDPQRVDMNGNETGEGNTSITEYTNPTTRDKKAFLNNASAHITCDRATYPKKSSPPRPHNQRMHKYSDGHSFGSRLG